MSLTGIFRSPYQRRVFFLTSGLLILAFLAAVWSVFHFAPDTRGWNALNDVLISVVASAVFAIVSALYLTYFFVDTERAEMRSRLVPQDIGGALRDVASVAMDYRIYVRTGRHFRSDILPILAGNAIRGRRPINVDVILLDFRDDKVCEQYAVYRRSASFDRVLWDSDYVKKEVLATILEITAKAAHSQPFLNISLSLSSRLSTFRIEGSSQEIIVTREDPKDMAVRYSSSDYDHAAFATEFNWIRDSADPIEILKDSTPRSLVEMFGGLDVITKLGEQAEKSRGSRSPYAR